MGGLMTAIQEGGASMYGLLCCATVGNPLALIALFAALFSKKRGVGIGLGSASFALGALTLLVGVGAYFYWMHVVEMAVAFADAESRQMLYDRGRQEAMNNIWLGAGASLFPMLLGVAAVARGVMLPSPPPSARG